MYDDASVRKATDELICRVYDELRELAHAKMGREQKGHLLQTTALVHEAWDRLRGREWESRAHFFKSASLAMERILVDDARARNAAKRGGGRQRVEVVDVAQEETPDEVVEVSEALSRLDVVDEEAARVLRLSYYLGMNHDEIADSMGMSRSTVERRLVYARSWIHRELTEGGSASARRS
jgi:RNA polymerase sigma factor (TIGR02999 family)